ncbi:unnamed protein product [Candidula unifasciata]|uniref:tRNA selenocysteine-associated protein 1 n=1 Tax=Candidula unifasciata TaxID=100452 RepID=A0A8S3YZI6_9EUPU|nr:unnamed protein product [Candidula unifasciata]
MYNTALSTSLWMGDLDSSLDEPAIISAFAKLGEVAVSVRMMADANNCGSLSPGNYCFVEFPDVDSAQRVLQRLNGKHIPGKPGRCVCLMYTYGKGRQVCMPEFSLFVGELSWNVDDYELFAFFQKRYKFRGELFIEISDTYTFVLDHNGKSRGFGFVRFSEESDQQRALIEMQHMTGLGRRPIRVSLASVKRPSDPLSGAAPVAMAPPAPHNNYYTGHDSWGGYNYQYSQPYPHAPPAAVDYRQNNSQFPTSLPEVEDDSELLEDPGLEINVGKENREFIESSESFFTALEKSRWQPLDNIFSEIAD